MSLSGTHTPIAKEETPNSLQMNTDNMNGHNNSFINMQAIPIRVNRYQSNGVIPTNVTRSIQYSLNNLNIFQNLPRETLKGIDDLTRLKMALLSGINDEINWSLKKILAYSNKAPYIINLNENTDLLKILLNFIFNLKPIIGNFNNPIDSKNLIIFQNGLTSLLILRNLIQDSNSIQLLITNLKLKNFLIFILINFEKLINTNNNTDNNNKLSILNSNLIYFNELSYYTFDIIECLSSYLAPAKKDDQIYLNLVSILNFTKDRYILISILRSLSRLLVRSKSNEKSAADNLNDKTLDLIVSLLLIENDNDLITAALDLLYQYILPGSERILILLNKNFRYNILLTILPKILTINNNLPNYELLDNFNINLIKRLKPKIPKNAPKLSNDLFKNLIKLNEPKRSKLWLKCCFESVKGSEITQINLWKSYETKFNPIIKKNLNLYKKLLPAVEFIKNISNVFENASPMVVVDPINGQKRFIIKNIQPRLKPLTIEQAETIHSMTILNNTDDEDEDNENDNNNNSKSNKDEDKIPSVKQNTLPHINFETKLSDLSKAASTFLCLLSNDENGLGSKFCQEVKPIIFHNLADIPPLTAALSEYIDNTHGNLQ